MEASNSDDLSRYVTIDAVAEPTDINGENATVPPMQIDAGSVHEEQGRTVTDLDENQSISEIVQNHHGKIIPKGKVDVGTKATMGLQAEGQETDDYDGEPINVSLMGQDFLMKISRNMW